MSRIDDSILRKLGFCLWVYGRFNPSKNCIKWILKIKHLRQTKDSEMFEISFYVMEKMRLFSVFWSSVKSGQNTKNLNSAPLPGTFFCHYLHFCSVNFSPKLLLPRASYHASNQAMVAATKMVYSGENKFFFSFSLVGNGALRDHFWAGLLVVVKRREQSEVI